jgi:ketosteroid isomerase-like protein
VTTTAARAQAELALTASGQGAISSVSVNAMGTDEDGAHRELAARAARLIGDHLLSGQGSALEERLDRSGPV